MEEDIKIKIKLIKKTEENFKKYIYLKSKTLVKSDIKIKDIMKT